MGLEGDREYMIVREQAEADGVHLFLTQRDKRTREEAKPQSLAVLALIKPEMRDGALRLTWKGSDPVAVARDQGSGDEMTVKIHKVVVSAVDQGEPVAKWLSEHLGVKVRLVRASGAFHRLASQNFMQNTNQIMFQDAYPIHWFMQESVDELSAIAGQEIPWTSFRPNIVGQGGEPQAEHGMYEGDDGAGALLAAETVHPLPRHDGRPGEGREERDGTPRRAQHLQEMEPDERADIRRERPTAEQQRGQRRR
jgi:uncharacterized protein YcbX